jgi:hypothetical protein
VLGALIEAAGTCSPPCPPTSNAGLYGAAASALVSIAGWVTVHRLAVRRDRDNERRRDLRGEVDRYLAMVQTIRDQALSYWTGDGAATAREAFLIKQSLQELGLALTALGLRHSILEVADQMKAFRVTVSGGDFEVRSRSRLSFDHPRLQEISDSALVLMKELRERATKP